MEQFCLSKPNLISI